MKLSGYIDSCKNINFPLPKFTLKGKYYPQISISFRNLLIVRDTEKFKLFIFISFQILTKYELQITFDKKVTILTIHSNKIYIRFLISANYFNF